MKKRISKRAKLIIALLCAAGIPGTLFFIPTEHQAPEKVEITVPTFKKTDKEAAITWLQERNIYICTDAAKKAVSNDDFETLHYLLAAGWDINDSNYSGSCLWHAVNQEKEAMCRFLLEHGADANKGEPLHEALKNGHLEIVRLLLKHKADPKSFLTPLHLALIEEHENEVRSICGKQEDAAKQYSYQFAYLGWTEDPEQAEILVKAGANPADPHQTSPLLFAVKRNNLPMVDYLLNHGADPNIPGVNSRFVINTAALRGYTAVLERLIEGGAAVNIANSWGLTPLHMAAQSGHATAVKILLAAGASVNAEAYDGSRPIHEAAKGGNTEVVELLLGEDAMTHLTNADGNLPLHTACQHGQAAIAAMLIDNGADVNHRNARGQTPLMLAASADSPETVQALLDAGAKADEVDNRKRGLVDHALAKGKGKVLPLLFSRKLLNVNSPAPGNPNSSLLHYAAEHKLPEMATELLKHGANIHATDAYQDTALHSAAFRNDTATMAVLLKHGANIHAKNQKGNTALHYAARRNNQEAAQLLLKHQANHSEANHQGETPMEIALRNDNMDIFLLMMDEKAPLSRKLARLMEEQLERSGNRVLAELLAKKGYLKADKATLLQAAEKGQHGLCSYLLEQGMNVNTTNDAKESLLILATKSNRFPLVELLLSKGANVHHRDAQGKQALDYASAYNIRKALQNQLNESVKEYFHLVANRRPKDVKEYCKKLPDVNITDKDGNSAAIVAADKDRPLMVKVLHELGVDINRQNNTSKDSPLIKAAWRNSKYAAEKLCELGANVNLVNRDLNTALHLCCSENHRYIAQLLIRHKAELNLKNKWGLTPLQLATNRKRADICNLLTSADGIDVNISNNEHDTPLHSAARNGMNRHILSLCRCGALAHIPNDKGELSVDMIQHWKTKETVENYVRRIPLHEFMYSAWHGDLKTMKKLVKERPRIVDRKDLLGFTALHLAARNGQLKAVQYLCRDEDQIDDKNKNGQSPLDLAKLGKHTEVISYLENFDPETAEFDDGIKKKKKKKRKKRD